MEIINVNNLSYKYNDKLVLNNISFNINKSSFTSIIGPNGSGKTTLIKIMIGLIETNSDIIISNLKLNKSNLNEIRKKIGIVFDNPNNQFVTDTVIDEFAFTLENLNYSSNEINEKILKISEYFNIKDILNKELHTLSGGKKQLISLLSVLIKDPEILIMDEALSMMDIKERDEILFKLKKMTNKLTIINITHNYEELKYSDNIIVISEGKNILNDSAEEIFKQELILKSNGIKLPFIVDISLKLKYYNIIDKIYYDKMELINAIWK